MSVCPRLLPTPEAKLGSSGPDYARANRHGAGGDSLHEAVGRLLPTPRATDGSKGGPNQRGSSGDLMLPSAVTLMPPPSVAEQRFGDYTPAVARWESALGRLAPDPTEPTGKDGAHRLSARFVEWMMGLPDGWVTDPTIWAGWKPSTARNAQLKALGNGVVPQQAAAAIRHLLALRMSGGWLPLG